MDVSRRSFLAGGFAASLISAVPATPARALEAVGPIGLGFSLYGMRQVSIGQAIDACSEIGYDCLELPVQAGWPGDSAKLTISNKEEIREKLDQTGLRLSALMENLHAVVDDRTHVANLARLRAAGLLAHQLSPDRAPVIETILGGRPDQWDEIREDIVESLQDWAKVAEETKTVVAIKAHVGGAMHRPEHPVWVVQQLKNPWIRCVYDYSHFQLRRIDMEQSVKTLIPHTAFIHVKDSRGDPSKAQFLLPGEGDIDYARLIGLIAQTGYRRDIVVEVSGQLHNKPDYKAIESARICYNHLAPAFEKASVRRR